MNTIEQYAALRSRLQFAYDTGRLVPFIGSGLSFPACRLWRGFVQELEQEAGYTLSTDPQPSAAEIVRWANRAMQQLRLTRTSATLAEAIRRALSQSSEIPLATSKLAQTFWPLVLTTNYDDVYWTASANIQKVSSKILGRSPSDCHSVLSSLRTPAEPILWALQGFLGHVCSCPWPDVAISRLASEVVVGHEEYRRVTFNSPHFRRAFAEVFRSRSLLFIGFGLQDPYIMDLFSEILETFGPNPMPHYAFARAGEADKAFLAQRFNIIVITYDDHAEVIDLLDQLSTDLRAPRAKSNAWTYSMASGPLLSHGEALGALNIVAGMLPVPKERECVAVSVGRKDGNIWLGETSSALDHYVKNGLLPADWQVSVPIVQVNEMTFQLKSLPIFLIAARDEQGARDLRLVSAAIVKLLDAAVAGNFSVVHSPLLAAGRRRAHPATFLLTEMIRGFAKWHADGVRQGSIRLFIHVVAPDVLQCLRSGRIDIPEILLCDDLRFWLELEDRQGRVERLPYHCSRDTKVVSLISDACNFTSTGWTLDLAPAPRLGWHPLYSGDIDSDETLEGVGVVPGSTVRFSFNQPATPQNHSSYPVSRISDVRIRLSTPRAER